MTPANQALRAALKSGRKNKYGAEKCIVDGIKFASKKEARRYSELKLLQRAGKIKYLSRQVKYHLYARRGMNVHEHPNYEMIATYIADFTYAERANNGVFPIWVPVVEDTKGFRTKEYILKKKLMKANYGITIRET